MPRRKPKDRLYEQLATIGKAVGSGRRLELLEILAQGERTVEKPRGSDGLSVANASHHLRVLRQTQLSISRKAGLHVFYRLTSPNIYELSLLIRAIAERHLTEVNRIVESFLTARDEFEPVGREELLERARTDAVLVLDVRPSEEYRVTTSPVRCRCPWRNLKGGLVNCLLVSRLSHTAVGRIAFLPSVRSRSSVRKGHVARRLTDGFPEWRAAGFPIETSVKEVAA